MNVILIGFMGVGKSEVGKSLAWRLNLDYLDTDELIEKSAEMTIPEIFKKDGEERFREIEKEVIETLEDYDGFVISTGGGAVLREENVKMLKEIGPLVLLTASPEAIHERLKDKDDRPLLKDGDKLKKITEILEKRLPVYEKIADFTLDTTKITPAKAAEEIENWLI